MVVDLNHKKMIRIMVASIDRESIAVDSTFYTLTGVLNHFYLNKHFRDIVFVWNIEGSP